MKGANCTYKIFRCSASPKESGMVPVRLLLWTTLEKEHSKKDVIGTVSRTTKVVASDCSHKVAHLCKKATLKDDSLVPSSVPPHNRTAPPHCPTTSIVLCVTAIVPLPNSGLPNSRATSTHTEVIEFALQSSLGMVPLRRFLPSNLMCEQAREAEHRGRGIWYQYVIALHGSILMATQWSLSWHHNQVC